jgi:hypothetical protein
MRKDSLMKKIITLTVFGFFVFAAYAQKQDSKTQGFDPFSAQTTDTASTASSDSMPKRDTAAVVKPYERLVLNVDSVTNLITYVGVVEPQEINTNPDETTSSDSLYIRAKRWAVRRFTGGNKALFDVDKKNIKIVVNAWMPAYAYGNKYSKRDIGKYEFKMTIWIKEGRYKYQLSNFVHEGVKSNEGNVVRNYFEFYYTSPNSVKGNDLMLRYADKDIHKLIEDFKKRMKDPVIVDEEEW